MVTSIWPKDGSRWCVHTQKLLKVSGTYLILAKNNLRPQNPMAKGCRQDGQRKGKWCPDEEEQGRRCWHPENVKIFRQDPGVGSDTKIQSMFTHVQVNKRKALTFSYTSMVCITWPLKCVTHVAFWCFRLSIYHKHHVVKMCNSSLPNMPKICSTNINYMLTVNTYTCQKMLTVHTYTYKKMLSATLY